MGATLRHVENQCRQLIQQGQDKAAMELLFQFYSVISPLMYEQALQICPTEQEKINHTLEACREGIQIWLPQNSPNNGAPMIKELMEKFPIPVSPVTYIGDSGKKVRTLKNFIVGTNYILLLEKIGDDWGATSIPKRQHHGIPGKLTDTDKSSLPWRNQAFKVFGESEVRLLMGVCDPQYVASLITLPNSPSMCMEVARNILTADKPTDIHMVADYQKYAKTPGRALQYFNHILETTGIGITKGDPVNE